MKLKTKEETKEEIENLGICALSKFSAINLLCKFGLSLQDLIVLESRIREIECGLWTLVPLCLNNENKMFNESVENLTKELQSFIDITKAMKACIDSIY